MKNPKSPIYFSFYGMNVRVFSQSCRLDSEFLSQFNSFRINSTDNWQLDIQAELMPIPAKKNGLLLFRKDYAEVRINSLNKKSFNYFKDGQLVASASETKSLTGFSFAIESLEFNALQEVLYYYIHSTVGEYLERNGTVRLHSGLLQIGESAILLLGLPAFGKSELCYQAALNKGFVASDEIVLFNARSKVFQGWPEPIHLKEKPTNSTGRLDKTFFHRPKWIISPSSPSPNQQVTHRLEDLSIVALRSPSPFLTLKILIWTLLGFGLPQMLIYLVRPSAFVTWPKILTNRFLLGRRLLAKDILFLPKARTPAERFELLRNHLMENIVTRQNDHSRKEVLTESRKISKNSTDHSRELNN